MSILITLVTVLLTTTDADVEALRKTAPSYLTTETAREHLVYARLAGLAYGIDPDLLLSIAWYESRYTVDVVGPEVRGKHACGVMQPIMENGCPPNPTLLGGYVEGASHLRTWIDASRGNLRTAMLGYAGGYALIKACGEGPLMVERSGRQIDLCTVVDVRLHRAKWIQRTRVASTARS